MTVLVPMEESAYPLWLESAAHGYAEENVSVGRWPREGALERSQAEFHALLPQGLATPDQYLFEIRTTPGGTVAGFLWFAVVERHGLRGGFIYDLEVKPEFRRQGHGKRALEALEPLAAAMGLSTIGLHVFNNNPGAQALYRELGYETVSLNMLRTLGVSVPGPGGS